MDLSTLNLNHINHSTLGFLLVIIICSAHSYGKGPIDVAASVLTNFFKIVVKKCKSKGERKGNTCSYLILATVNSACSIRSDSLESTNLMACIQCALFLMIQASLFSGIPWSVFSPCEERNKFYRQYILPIKCLNYLIFIWAMMQDRRSWPLTLHKVSLLRKSLFQVPSLSLSFYI